MHQGAWQVGVLLWLGTCLPAIVWGGRAERSVGAALLANLLLVVSLHRLTHNNNVQWWSLAIDVAVLLVMIGVAVRKPPRWLLVAIGFQIIAVLVHVPRIIDPTIHQWAYAAANNFSGYAVVLALLSGTLIHLLRRDSRHARIRSQ